MPLFGSIFHGHSVLLNGTSGGRIAFLPRLAISFSMAARPPNPEQFVIHQPVIIEEHLAQSARSEMMRAKACIMSSGVV